MLSMIVRNVPMAVEGYPPDLLARSHDPSALAMRAGVVEVHLVVVRGVVALEEALFRLWIGERE
jgi:hypothetical protein